MSSVVLFRMFHILTAIWFVSGLLARGFALSQAARTSDVRIVAALVQLAARFERLIVIPGNAAVLLFGFMTAWLQGYPVFGVLQGASSNWLLVSVLLAASMVPVIPLVFIPHGKRFGAALEGMVGVPRSWRGCCGLCTSPAETRRPPGGLLAEMCQT